ncbi:Hypothetical predicted protein [Scomber scombrus]|uniref:Uncharacterized protein n=1 Tax=Scomber scombrus TaxID=13677 RepID=A0AAV1QB45_SCOSC
MLNIGFTQNFLEFTQINQESLSKVHTPPVSSSPLTHVLYPIELKPSAEIYVQTVIHTCQDYLAESARALILKIHHTLKSVQLKVSESLGQLEILSFNVFNCSVKSEQSRQCRGRAAEPEVQQSKYSQRRAAALLGLPHYLREDPSNFFKVCEGCWFRGGICERS